METYTLTPTPGSPAKFKLDLGSAAGSLFFDKHEANEKSKRSWIKKNVQLPPGTAKALRRGGRVTIVASEEKPAPSALGLALSEPPAKIEDQDAVTTNINKAKAKAAKVAKAKADAEAAKAKAEKDDDNGR